MNIKEYKEKINNTITLKNRNVLFFINIKGKPQMNGEVECQEKKCFNNIFELVDFVNTLKQENFAGYHEVKDETSNLYIYLRGVEENGN